MADSSKKLSPEERNIGAFVRKIWNEYKLEIPNFLLEDSKIETSAIKVEIDRVISNVERAKRDADIIVAEFIELPAIGKLNLNDIFLVQIGKMLPDSLTAILSKYAIWLIKLKQGITGKNLDYFLEYSVKQSSIAHNDLITLFAVSYHNLLDTKTSILPNPDFLKIIVDHGDNPDLMADILADLSLLYKLEEGGSGINFTPEMIYELLNAVDHE